LNVENKIGQPNAPEQEKSVRWQTFCATASLGAAFACCASEAGHITQKPRLAGEGRWLRWRRAEIATFLPVKALERPANSAHLAPWNTSASSQHSDLVLAQVLEVVARAGR
jgi:hypothetical protein